eukprot:Hpha_TRINITY_DN15517_c0_g2::TRINITY_DN15517_c0_g2_i1::g.107111::m.107111
MPRKMSSQGEERLRVKITHAVLAYTRSDLTVFYNIEVHKGTAIWNTSKRYSDIERLHRALLGEIHSTKVGKKIATAVGQVFSGFPSLPSKNIFQSTNSSIRLIEKRRRALESYLQSVVPRTTGTPGQFVLDMFLSSSSLDGIDQLMASEQEMPHDVANRVEVESGGWVLPTVVTTTWSLERRAHRNHHHHRLPQRPVLVALPWAREWDNGSGTRCVKVKSVRFESRQTVHRRFLEFRSVLEWMSMENSDKVFTAQEVMHFISRRRAHTWEHFSPRRHTRVIRESVLRTPGDRTYFCGPSFAEMTLRVTPPAE